MVKLNNTIPVDDAVEIILSKLKFVIAANNNLLLIGWYCP